MTIVGCGQGENMINRYEDLFTIGNNRMLNMLKIRVIQAMIQIERPRNWDVNRVRKLGMECWFW